MKDALKRDGSPGPVAVAVCADPAGDGDLARAASRIAGELGLPLLKRPFAKGYELLLVAAPGRLELRVVGGDLALKGVRPVWVNLEEVDTVSGAGRSFKQPIAKAVGLRGKKDSPVTVIDATAGWGKDAWLLASLGCRVLAVERSSVVAVLLKDGLLRAGTRSPQTLERLSVLAADSRDLLRRIAQAGQGSSVEGLPEEAQGFVRPDVVYLDPMFAGAERRKTAEKYPMRVLRRLVGADGDARELFDCAMQAAGRRVVVKRPAKGSMDFGVKPVATHQGKGFCFDVYPVLAVKASEGP